MNEALEATETKTCFAERSQNIRLDDNSRTNPCRPEMEKNTRVIAAKRLLTAFLPGEPSQYRVADLGCLEGGFTVEFARMGYTSLGIEANPDNFRACEYVKSRVNVPNLSFVQDDVRNIEKYGEFDAIYCGGLLYHLDRPRAFLEALSGVARHLLILDTHFAGPSRRPTTGVGTGRKPRYLEAIAKLRPPLLSRLTLNEGLPGRWYREREGRWASWGNKRSFWIQREHLLQAISDVGFDLCLEQYDWLSPEIAAELGPGGAYQRTSRGVFVGVKTS